MTMTVQSPRRLRRDVSAVGIAAVVVGIVATLGVMTRIATGPRFVHAVTVTNDTPYDLTITLSGQAGGSTTPLGIAPARATAQFLDVIDQGSTWYVDVRSEGRDAAQLTISRSALAAQGWHLEFGAAVTARLGQAGVAPTPGPGG